MAAAAPALAQAHDTWFSPQPAVAGGPLRLALGTGEHFPRMTSPVGAEHLRLATCTQSGGATLPLRAERTRPAALLLRTEGRAPAGATCWADLQPQDITLDAPQVAAYLDELRASPALRAQWAAQQARGVPWRERFTKHARIELPADSGPAAPLATPPRSAGLEVVPERAWAWSGEPYALRLLRDGQPLPHATLALLSDTVNAAFWLQTDGQGRATVRVPLPGRWLLRAIDLQPDATQPGQWHSRFATLAFEARALGSGTGAAATVGQAGQAAAAVAAAARP